MLDASGTDGHRTDKYVDELYLIVYLGKEQFMNWTALIARKGSESSAGQFGQLVFVDSTKRA